MRSFVTTLLALSLPLSIFAGHSGRHARRHSDLAVRARGDILQKRESYDNVRLTYYDITVGTTACGGTYGADAFVVALDQSQFGTKYPSPYCNQQITITVNGKSTTATIVDSCPGCPAGGGLDLTQGLFQYFGPLSQGVLTGSWQSGGGAAPAPAPAPAPSSSQPAPAPAPTTTNYTPKPSPTPTSTYSPPAPSPSSSSNTPAPAQATSTPATTSATSTPKPAALLSSSTSTSSSLSTSVSQTSGLAQPSGSISVRDNLEGLTGSIMNLGRAVRACADA